MMYLLDTDVLIEVLRGKTKVARYLKALYEKGNVICYSPVTKAEIYCGIRPGEDKKTAALFAQLECLPIHSEVGEKAGYYMKMYRKSHNVQLGDALIAATASWVGTHLFTLNDKHYPMTDIKFHSPKK
ncbi:type II toxin-antitoxin system VapC family toxin [Candidatus Aerophobetes bacterium]|uniref:Type II toxin-antitoxin system VapC family toxin n=1 Tax=Aerophobetes bacterium TaxID=2030807 RepID=A0A523S277_UNCAE|nr:MAG: type II toxin-antitoxin system VapC family toxin [Candidatus Aerophobetes bacterium]